MNTEQITKLAHACWDYHFYGVDITSRGFAAIIAQHMEKAEKAKPSPAPLSTFDLAELCSNETTDLEHELRHYVGSVHQGAWNSAFSKFRGALRTLVSYTATRWDQERYLRMELMRKDPDEFRREYEAEFRPATTPAEKSK